MSQKYVGKSDVADVIKLQRPDFVASTIPDNIMLQANRKVDAELARKKVFPLPNGTADDYCDFLKTAAMFFALDLCSKHRLIAQASGELGTDKFRDVTYQYQRLQPMFFFAQGSSKPFLELLSSESLRMYAFSFVSAYKDWWFYNKTGQRYPKSVLARYPRKRNMLDAEDEDFYREDWSYDY